MRRADYSRSFLPSRGLRGRRLFVAAGWLLLLSLAGLAAPPETVSAPPGPGTDDAVILQADRSYTLLPDGSSELRVVERKKLLTGVAVNRLLGETFLTYNAAWQDLKVDHCVTTMADGTRVPTPENGYNRLTLHDVYDSPDFSDVQELVVTHTGLEPGAETDLGYTVRTRPGFLPFFSCMEMFGSPFPIQSMTVTVTVPAGTKLAYAVRDLPPPVITSAGASRVYRWTLERIPAYPEERMSPNRWETIPVLYFSAPPAGGGWPDLLRGLPGEGLSDAERTDLLAEPLPEAPTVMAAARVVEAVRKGVRTVPLTPVEIGWRPASPAAVYRRGYGTPLEKAGLLASVMRQSGFKKVQLGFLIPNLSGLENVPVPGLVRGVLVLAEVEGRMLYLDPDGAIHLPGGACFSGKSWVSETERFKFPESGEPSRFNLDATLGKWEGTRCRLTGSIEMTGDFFTKTAFGDAAKTAESILDGAFTDFKLENKTVRIVAVAPGTLSFTFEADAAAAARTAGDLFLIDAPPPPPVAALRELCRALSRSAPVQVPEAPLDVRTEWRVNLPAGAEVVYRPADAERGGELAQFHQTVSTEGEQVKWTRRMAIRQPRVPAAEYPQLRQALVPWLDDTQSRLILRVKAAE